MPFIGQQPLTGAYSKLDSITTSATATYNLQLDSAAYSPASANHLLVSLNGVMQAPQDSFTVSGSTITFASALTSSDNIDFIMAMGDVLNIGTPSDGTVTTAKIAASAVTDAKIASNAVTTAKIANSAITDAKLASTLDLSAKTLTMPTGHIIQKVIKVSATAVTVTNAVTATAFGLNQSFTPKFANSTILINISASAEHYGTHTDRGLRFELRKDNVQQDQWDYVDYHSNDNSQNINLHNLVHVEGAVNTTARTYDVIFRASHNANCSARVNTYNGPSYLIITEIAG
jgi:hypothetical protein